MIHQSQLFVCPGQDHGISWNICRGRQEAKWEPCTICPYAGWQKQGLPGFNPYCGSFTQSEDPRIKLPKAPRTPRRGPIYARPVTRLLPQDIGLEPPRRRDWMDWARKLYDAI